MQLDSPAAILRGGDSGAVLKANDEQSLLLLMVQHANDVPAMPPKNKLSDIAIADMKTWVKIGLPMPTATQAKIPESSRDFWSFQPVREQALPAIADATWPIQRLDHFILSKLNDKKLKPALTANRRTLIRRVYFDIVGLPPTYEQVEAFVADTRPDAYERLVDSLLASPRFGEKWGRHWFDVVRYAEDNSTSEATCKPPRFPFRYRDWVIGALNSDMPYDRFLQLQLAADLMPETAPADYAALGFLGLSPVYHKEPRLSKDVISAFVADEWDERVDTITRGFLGLTVACARCHDHKFDPITTEDYYALAGVLANTQIVERPLKMNADADQDMIHSVRRDILDISLRISTAKEMRGNAIKNKQELAVYDLEIKTNEAKLVELRKREKGLDVTQIATVVRDAGTWVNGDNPAWTVIDYKPGEYRNLPVFIRGNPARPGTVVPRRFLTVLSRGEPKPFNQGSGRRELASAIVGEAGGLSSRVFVNRVWGWVFGRSLVTTPSNFGILGERPSHPELLDDLAARFVANRWSLKWLIREIVLSATYKQSSDQDDNFAITDPDDIWRWRAPRKRLELEAWRDAMLQVSGQLDLAGGGPSDNLDSPRAVRRTVFGMVSRQRPADIHRLFDLPDPKGHGEKREATTTPVQQLYFLNSPFVRQSASAVVKKVIGNRTGNDAIQALFKAILLREATSDELATSLMLVTPMREGSKPAWELLAQTLLASNEFLFLN